MEAPRSPRDGEPDAGLTEAFRRGGAMGALMAGHDWAASPVGPPGGWPPGLRFAVSLLLASSAEIVLFWGPDYIAFYNDAYAPTIGDKHPAALGRPAREHWSELWEDLEPLLDGVRETGESFTARDRPFLIDRRGFLERVHFDVSYDPIRATTGEVDGILCIVAETTARVLGERRLRGVRELSRRIAGLDGEEDVAAAAVAALTDPDGDVPWAHVHRAAGARGFGPRAAGVPREVQRSVADGRVRELPLAALTASPPERAAEQALVLPLRAGSRRLGALIAAVDRHLALDDAYRDWLAAAADEIARALAERRAHAEERAQAEELQRNAERMRHVASVLQHAILPERLPELRGATAAARYLPGTRDLQVGGDWYDIVELDGPRVGLVIGDVVGRGVQAAAAMVQLRNAMRAFLLQGLGPAEALRQLDRLVDRIPNARYSTLACAVLDLRAGLLHHTTAGHLPLLHLGADGAYEWLTVRPTMPLGVMPGGGPYAEARADVRPGDTVVLYTDGLVERRDAVIDARLERLATVAGAFEGDPARMVDGLIGELLGDESGADDTAVLAVSLTPSGAPVPSLAGAPQASSR